MNHRASRVIILPKPHPVLSRVNAVENPRVRVAGILEGSDAKAIEKTLRTFPHTRYPLYEHNLDRVIGVVHVKSLLRLLLGNERVQAGHAQIMPTVGDRWPGFGPRRHPKGTGADGARGGRIRRNGRYRDVAGSVLGGRRQDGRGRFASDRVWLR